MGSAAAARKESRRRGGASALCNSKTLWRQGWLQSLDGGDPRAFCRKRTWPAQRSAERAFDRRQPAIGDDARSLWKRRAEGDDRGFDHWKIPHHLWPDRARARLGCDAYGNQGGTGDPRQHKGLAINGEKMWTPGMRVATHCARFARTSGNDGDARGITCFLVPAKSAGVKVEEYMWTFNMPTDHPRVSFTDVFVPEDALFGEIGRGLSLAQCFVHENRIRQ